MSSNRPVHDACEQYSKGGHGEINDKMLKEKYVTFNFLTFQLIKLT